MLMALLYEHHLNRATCFQAMESLANEEPWNRRLEGSIV